MIVLINPPGLKTFSGLNMHTPNPPLGLAYIAAALKQAGFQYKVIDCSGEALDSIRPYPARPDFMTQGLSLEEAVQRVPHDADIIGFSCNFSTLWPITRMLAEKIREHFPQALLILGGEHGTAVPEFSLRTSVMDLVALGEGEETVVEIVRAFREKRSLENIPGTAIKTASGEIRKNGLAKRIREIDDIPLPDWKAFPLEEYISRHQGNGVNMGRSMPLLATRGCPYQCTFCSNPAMWTIRYIMRDPKKLVDEMEMHMKEYRVTNFDLQDLTAIVNRRWAIEFCKEIIDRGLNITWQLPSGTRSEVFDEELAAILYKSGCHHLAFAPESGSPEVLRIVKKRVNLDHLLEAARITVKHGFVLNCFMVIGLPSDNVHTLRQSMKFVRKLAVMGVHDVVVSKFVPYPGSELFIQFQKEKKIQLDDEFFESPMDFYNEKSPSYCDAISSKRLYWTMISMFLNFYFISVAMHPLRTIRITWNAVTKGQEETRYAKWLVDRLYVRRKWRQLHRDEASTAAAENTSLSGAA